MTQPRYGSSGHYSGDAGERYFRVQTATAEPGVAIAATRFSKYIKDSDTVIDFGCGGGGILAALNCRRRIGIEVNPTARARAEARGVECYESIEQLPDETADVVISNHALEHVPSPIVALTTIRQKLRTGGTFVLCVPIDDWRVQKRYDMYDKNHHLHTWTPLLLGHTLAEAGFRPNPENIRVVTHAWLPFLSTTKNIRPKKLFDAFCWLWSVTRKRRQLFVVTVKS